MTVAGEIDEAIPVLVAEGDLFVDVVEEEHKELSVAESDAVGDPVSYTHLTLPTILLV